MTGRAGAQAAHVHPVLVARDLDGDVVSVGVGPPVALGLEDPDEDTAAIMAAIVDLLPPEAREWHEPTAEELAAAMPSGASVDDGDSEHQAARRPGSD